MMRLWSLQDPSLTESDFKTSEFKFKTLQDFSLTSWSEHMNSYSRKL